VTESRLHTEDPQKLGITTQNLLTMTTWSPGFAHFKYSWW